MGRSFGAGQRQWVRRVRLDAKCCAVLTVLRRTGYTVRIFPAATSPWHASTLSRRACIRFGISFDRSSQPEARNGV
jgi:hypothetical protein